MKRQLILAFARISKQHPKEVVEALQDMEASGHELSPPKPEQAEQDEE